jgi:hypothetical protein
LEEPPSVVRPTGSTAVTAREPRPPRARCRSTPRPRGPPAAA